MNKKILVGMGLLTAASAFAQYSFEPTTMPSTEASAPAPAPVVVAPGAAKPAEVATIANFDNLRGNAYESVSNEAAASTVNGYLGKPHNFAERNFLYVQPMDQQGVVAWGKGTTYFMGLDDSEDLGLLTVGLANKGSFGLALNLAMGKTWSESKQGTVSETNTVEAGDRIGVAFSTAGTHTLGASLDWFTYDTQVSTADVTQKVYNLLLDVNYGNGPSAGKHFWTAGLKVLRHQNSTEAGSVTEAGEDARIEVTPYLNYGTKVLSNERARVFIGMNNQIIVQSYDGVSEDATAGVDGRSKVTAGAKLSPNVLGELALTESWLLFGGASHDILLGYASETDAIAAEGTPDLVTTDIQARSTVGTSAMVGIRYQKERYAVEASLENAVYVQGPAAIFNGGNILAQMGGFLYF